MRRAARWTLRIVAACVVLFVLASLAAGIFIHTDTGRAFVRERVVDQLAQTFAGTVSIGRLEGSPFGTLVAHDVTITDAHGHPAIVIERVAIEVELLPLVRKRLSLSKVTASGVVLQARREPDGTLSLAHLLRPGPKSTWTVIVDELAVHGRVAVDAGGEPIHVDDLAIAGSLRASADTFAAAIDTRGMWRERSAPLHAILSAQRDRETFTVPVLAAHVGTASVHAANLRFDGSTLAGAGVVRASRAEVARLTSVDSFADLELAFHTAPGGERPVSVVPSTNVKVVEETNRARDVSQAGTSPSSSTKLEIIGTHGEAGVRGDLDLWVAARRIAGTFTASNVDVALLSRDRVPVRGGGTVTLDASFGNTRIPSGHVIVSAHVGATGAYRSVPPTSITSTLTSDGKRVCARLDARSSEAEAIVAADVVIDGERVGLDGMRVSASSRDLARATGGLVAARGRVDLVANASGALLPKPELAVTGRLDGRKLRATDLGLDVDSLVATVDARRLPYKPAGRAELVAHGIDRRGEQGFALRELKLTAADRPDGAIQASLRTRPVHDPWLIEADALIRTGDVVTVDLQRHRVRAGGGAEWTGTTGRLAIARDRIVLRDMASTTKGDGALLLAGTLQRTGPRAGDLAAQLDVRRFSLDNVDPSLTGRIADAHVEVARRRGRLTGEASFEATGLQLPHTLTASLLRNGVRTSSGTAPTAAASIAQNATTTSARTNGVRTITAVPFDARGNVRFDGRGLTLDVRVDGKAAGTAQVKADLDAPGKITDARAWRRLDRSAIREAQLDLAKVDVRGAARIAGIELPGGEEGYGGVLDGQLRIEGGVPNGRMQLRAVQAPQLRGLGAIDAELVLARSVGTGPVYDGDGAVRLAGAFVDRPRDGVTASLVAHAKGIGRIDGKVELLVPDRVFDPAGWSGRRVLRRGTLSARDIAIDPGRLQQLGIVATAHGRLSIDADVVPDRASVTVKATELRGAPIARPVAVEARATIDERRAVADVVVASSGVRIVEAHAEVPITLDQLIADPRALRTRALVATARLPKTPASTLLAMFGRTEIVGGTLDGTVEVGGTFDAPTAAVKIVGSDLRARPGFGGRKIETVRRIVVDGTWRGRGGKLAIDAVQDRGTLKVVVEGSPDAPRDVTMMVAAKDFDLVPLLVFAPGPAGGAAGRLDANVTVRGADPATAIFAGELHLRGARIPLAPSVGTLRRAKVDLVVRGKELQLAVDGRLGGGTVKASGAIGLDASRGNAKLTLRGVRPIGIVEPAVDADVTVAISRDGRRWLANVGVDKATVKVPSSRGKPLAPSGAPTDMRIVTGERITRRPLDKRPPEEPMLIANIAIAPTRVESDEFRGIVRGRLTVTLDVGAVGIVGVIEADRGEIDLFGRRYRAERALVRFDGGLDPLLDISLVHEFPEVVTTTQVRGRASQPKLVLRSDPGTYSEGQLLGFLLGGEPSRGDPGGAGDRAAGASASYVANRIGRYVRGALPVDLDVLRYEAATSTTSAAVTVGTWLSSDLFLAYRRRLDARPDENSGEGEVEYWLFRRIVIEGVIGDRGRNAIDLLWRKRY